MRWVLITPFGTPVDPEVKSSLAIVSGPTSAVAVRARARARARQLTEAQGAVALPACHERLRNSRSKGIERRRERPRVVCEHDPGPGQLRDRLDARVIGAHQRVGDADRHHRHTGAIGGQGHEQMLDRVTRQDHDRAIGPEPQLPQHPAERLGLGQRVPVGERDPPILAITLRRQRTIGMLGGLRAQHRGHRGLVLLERPARAQPHRPVVRHAASRRRAARTSRAECVLLALMRDRSASRARSACACGRCSGHDGGSRRASRDGRCCRRGRGSGHRAPPRR